MPGLPLGAFHDPAQYGQRPGHPVQLRHPPLPPEQRDLRSPNSTLLPPTDYVDQIILINL
jgi:hypothetical protein